MEIRLSVPKDAEGIARVLKASYNIESLEEGREAYMEEYRKGIVYVVAADRKRVAGIVTLKFLGLPKHGLCELDRIAVLPEYKGKGVSDKLFKALVAEARRWYKERGSKLRKLIILTHADNTRAHRFYEKMGLKHETTLKDHYYRGKDEFVFSMFFR